MLRLLGASVFPRTSSSKRGETAERTFLCSKLAITFVFYTNISLKELLRRGFYFRMNYMKEIWNELNETNNYGRKNEIISNAKKKCHLTYLNNS